MKPATAIVFRLPLPALHLQNSAGGGGFLIPDQTGTAARFNVPAGIAVDSAGNIYVADTFNNGFNSPKLSSRREARFDFGIRNWSEPRYLGCYATLHFSLVKPEGGNSFACQGMSLRKMFCFRAQFDKSHGPEQQLYRR